MSSGNVKYNLDRTQENNRAVRSQNQGLVDLKTPTGDSENPSSCVWGQFWLLISKVLRALMELKAVNWHEGKCPQGSKSCFEKRILECVQ